MKFETQPPAFQEYAANLLASVEIRQLNEFELGLLFLVRLECWVNVKLPADPRRLALLLNRSQEWIETCLPALLDTSLLEEKDGFITSPGHEVYREKLRQTREAKAKGGQKGAEITNRKKRTSNDAGMSSGMSSGMPHNAERVSRGSLVQHRVVQNNLEKHSNQGEGFSDVDPWLDEYDNTPNS